MGKIIIVISDRGASTCNFIFQFLQGQWYQITTITCPLLWCSWSQQPPPAAVIQINVPTDEYTVMRISASDWAFSEHARKQMQTVWIKTPTRVLFSCRCRFRYIWKWSIICIYSISRVIFIPPCTLLLSPVLLTGTEKPCVKAVAITRAHVCIDRRATDLFMHFWIFINLQTAKESIKKNTCGIAFHRLPTRHDMYRPAVHIESQACPCTFTRRDTCGVMQTCNSSWRRK